MSSDYRQMALSHTLVMETVRRRYPSLPNFLFRLSASNLYFYFAHQSQQRRNYAKTLFWLGQAIQADSLTCWIRPGLYQLTLGSVWQWALARLVGTYPHTFHHAPTPPLTLTQIAQRQKTIALMLMVGSSFHQIISWLTRQPLGFPQALTLTSGGNTP
jgi:hypothetical protein